MANKMNMMKLLLENRSLAQLTNRRPAPRHPGLITIQLRTHLMQTTKARRKQMISVDMKDMPELPHPVKITHRSMISSAHC